MIDSNPCCHFHLEDHIRNPVIQMLRGVLSPLATTTRCLPHPCLPTDHSVPYHWQGLCQPALRPRSTGCR